MKKLLVIIAAGMLSAAAFADGQLVFSTKVGSNPNAPVSLQNTPTKGPGTLTGGEAATAELFMVSLDGVTKNVSIGTSPFRTESDAASKYVNGPVITVPGSRGGGDPNGAPSSVTLVFRAWQTSFGSYDASIAANVGGTSSPFTITLGGGTLTPANLTGLTTGFTYQQIPEPSTIALGLLGAAALLIRRRK